MEQEGGTSYDQNGKEYKKVEGREEGKGKENERISEEEGRGKCGKERILVCLRNTE